MTQPKSAERPPITFHLTPQELDEVDKERAEAIASVPGARFSRSAWAQSIARRHLAARRAAGAAATESSETAPAPARPPKKR